MNLEGLMKYIVGSLGELKINLLMFLFYPY